jgi:cell wall assembly regulator SMI1
MKSSKSNTSEQTDDFNQLLDRVADWWRQDEVEANPGASQASISAFHETYGVPLPSTMEEFYRRFNGDDGRGDSNHYSFWELDRVKLVTEELVDPIHKNARDYPHCYVFCDYMIWAWAYAVRIDPDDSGNNPIIIVSDSTPQVVAASFTEFLETYLNDEEKLWDFPGTPI